MSELHQLEIPATVFYVEKLFAHPIDEKSKCAGCHYEYPNDRIKRHICPFFDNVKCTGCKFVFPVKAIKRHVYTYYRCKKHYEENENEKRKLNQVLNERKLDDLDKFPQPNDCFCVKNVGKCLSCEM